MDLFQHAMNERMAQEAPLAARMRPRTLDEIVGQEAIIGPGRLLRRAIEADRLFSSILLWGPPGTGKTTLARLIAQHTKAQFEIISAVLAGVAGGMWDWSNFPVPRVSTVVAPDRAAAAVYQGLYEVYRESYRRYKDLYPRLAGS